MRNPTETTTSGGMGTYNNNIDGWDELQHHDFPYDLNEAELKDIQDEVFEPVKFYHLSKFAKKFFRTADSTSVRGILQSADALKVPLSNLLGTFYTSSLSVFRIAEEVMANGNQVKYVSTGPEWWYLIINYSGIDFIIFSAVYGNPVPDPANAPAEICMIIKASDFDMISLVFPDLEFQLNPEIEDESPVK